MPKTDRTKSGAKTVPKPSGRGRAQRGSDTQRTRGSAQTSNGDHAQLDAHQRHVANGSDHRRVESRFANVAAESSKNGHGQGSGDAHTTAAVAVNVSAGDGQGCRGIHTESASPADALVGILADSLYDLEKQRVATENRLRSLRQVKGLEGSKAELELVALVDSLERLEKDMTKSLERAVRQHPLGPFVKRTVGLGEKQIGRLLGAVGDPAVKAAVVDRETGEILEPARLRRGPAELWAYCGLHTVPAGHGRADAHAAITRRDGDTSVDQNSVDVQPADVDRRVAARRRKGVVANWNSEAKMRAYLCAESCIKQRRSPYRAVYDRERVKWAERDTSDAHRHAHALRVVAKAILRDLWKEARATGESTSTLPAPALLPKA